MMKNNVTHCPACLSKEKAKAIGLYSVCALCKTMYVPVLPNPAKLQERVEEEGSWIVNDEQDLGVTKTQEDRVHVISKYIDRGGNLIDVGCGKGQFLVVAKKAGFKVAAMDKSEKIVAFIKQYLKVPAFTDMKEVKSTYDSATSFDVIEHVIDPNVFINEIRSILNKNGILMITTPNALGISGRILNASWWVFGPESHLNLFTPNALKMLLERNGFKVLQVHTDTLTQWWPSKNNFTKKMLNKIIYTAFGPFQRLLFTHYLGDNIEIIARKI